MTTCGSYCLFADSTSIHLTPLHRTPATCEELERKITCPQTGGRSLVFTGCWCSVNLRGKTNRTCTESFHLFLLLCLFFFSFFFWKTKNHSKNFLNTYFFIFTCLKWDTEWTLVSQNNKICFCLVLSWDRKGLLKTFWLMIRRICFDFLSVQPSQVYCVMYRTCFLAVLLFPSFVQSSLLSNSRSRLMCLFFCFFTWNICSVSCSRVLC